MAVLRIRYSRRTVIFATIISLVFLFIVFKPPLADVGPPIAEREDACKRPKVDFVYTWVDSKTAENEECEDVYRCGKHRFRDNQELRFSLRSLQQNARDVLGHIYIVTADGKGPTWLIPDENLSLVAHKDIFDRPEKDLPSFNSHAIEWSLPNIKGLREHFVYLNDDFFVVNRVTAASFFSCDDKIVIRPEGKESIAYSHLGLFHTWFAMLSNTRHTLDRLFGKHLRLYLQHAPYAFTKSVFNQVKNDPRLREQVVETISHRYRSENDIQPAMMVQYYMAHQGRANLPPVGEHNTIFESWLNPSYNGLTKEDLKDDTFICLQDPGESGRADTAKILLKIRKAMEELFPIPSKWEKKQE